MKIKLKGCVIILRKFMYRENKEYHPQEFSDPRTYQVPLYPEEWSIVNINGVWYTDYSVSTYGRVYSNKSNGFITPNIINTGYYCVNLYIDGNTIHVLLHRLVMMSFRPCLNMNNLDVNHIYGNKSDNYLFHLEWTDKFLNCQHQNILNNEFAYTEKQIHKICQMREQGLQISDIIKNLGLKYSETERMRVRRIIIGDIYKNISSQYNMIPLESEKYAQKINENDVKKICEMRMKLMTPKEICKEMNWDYLSTKSRVNLIINKKIWLDVTKDYNFPPYENLKFGQKFNETIVRQICELRMQSKSLKEIMRELNLDYNDQKVKDRVYGIISGRKWKNVIKDYDLSSIKNQIHNTIHEASRVEPK